MPHSINRGRILPSLKAKQKKKHLSRMPMKIGHRFSEKGDAAKDMRRLLTVISAIILSLLVCFVVSSCGNFSEETNPETESSSELPSEPTAPDPDEDPDEDSEEKTDGGTKETSEPADTDSPADSGETDSSSTRLGPGEHGLPDGLRT